jgi:4-hydroxy-tetrahydrodipicolinate reductase
MSLSKRLVYVHGLGGAMGQEIESVLLTHERFALANSVSTREINRNEILSAEFVIDFSSREGSMELAKFFSANSVASSKKYVLIGTTGFSKSEQGTLQSEYAKTKCKALLAPNTSLGVRVFLKQVSNAATALYPEKFDIEIIETHHQRKVDAPSGTALLIAESIQRKVLGLDLVFSHTKKRRRESIGVHSVRGGSVFGEHEVRFLGASQELSFKHRAFSRALFAEGAVALLSELEQQKEFLGLKTLLDWLDEV